MNIDFRAPIAFPQLTTVFSFYYLRLYRERITQIEAKLTEVRSGKASEYLQPLEELQVNMKNRMEVGAILRELRLQNIKCKYDAEQLANEQNFKVSNSSFVTEGGHISVEGQCPATYLPPSLI